MSGSAKKRREKARRKNRIVRGEESLLALAREHLAQYDRERREFDAAFPGMREQFGSGSEVLGMMRGLFSCDATLNRREPAPATGHVLVDGRALPSEILNVSRPE